MKHTRLHTQKSKRKNAGFTLLELVVVVAVMGLISTMAMDVYTDQSNQKRFDATKQRLAEIKFAIIGDPMMRVGSQAVLTGFFKDMGRFPRNLTELTADLSSANQSYPNNGLCITDYHPDDSQTSATCTGTSRWILDSDDQNKWKGPYIHNLQTNGNAITFADAWGNNFVDASGDIDDWSVDASGNLTVTSAGLNGVLNPADSGYDEDKATTIYATELAQLDYLKSLNTGYCVNPSTNKIELSFTSQASCISPNVWGSWP